jgi:hypothetical protein
MVPVGSAKFTVMVAPRIRVSAGPYRRTIGVPLLCRSSVRAVSSQPARHVTRVWIVSMPIAEM